MSTHEETGERRGHVLPKVTKKSVKSWRALGLLPPSCPWTVSPLIQQARQRQRLLLRESSEELSLSLGNSAKVFLQNANCGNEIF